MQHTEVKPTNKVVITIGTIFFACVGGMTTGLLFGIALGFISFIYYSLFAVLSLFFFPAIIGSAIGSSYLFLRNRSASKDRLKKTYSQVIILIILGYLSLAIYEQILSNQVRLRYEEYEDAILSNNFSAAYQLMSEDYKATKNMDEFIRETSIFKRPHQGLLPLWSVDVNVFTSTASIDPYQSSFFDYGDQVFLWEKN